LKNPYFVTTGDNQLFSDTKVISPHKRYTSLSKLFSLEGVHGVSTAGQMQWGGEGSGESYSIVSGTAVLDPCLMRRVMVEV